MVQRRFLGLKKEKKKKKQGTENTAWEGKNSRKGFFTLYPSHASVVIGEMEGFF